MQISQSHAQKANSVKNLTKTLENKSNLKIFVPKSITADTTQKGVEVFTDTAKSKKSTTLINTIDSIKISKDSLDAPVQYAASDSGVFIISTKEFFFIWKKQSATARFDFRCWCY